MSSLPLFRWKLSLIKRRVLHGSVSGQLQQGIIPCPLLVVAGLPPISSISKAPALFPTGKKLGNVALASEGEGAVLCPSKDSIVTETKLGCLSPLSPLPSGLHFQMPSFNPE